MTKFLLDSGDPNEYREIAALMKEKAVGANDYSPILWGSTTNPSLIAKSASRRIAGKKLTPIDAFKLQKELVEEILTIVPGAVSAEVYADEQTTADQMIEQGRDIATWHERIVVKLPTTIEGFKARTTLRKEKIPVNNTLVFSQQQIYAICLHEKLIQQTYDVKNPFWPPFISPFLGRLDDIGEDGIALLKNGLRIENELFEENQTWMLSASIRTIQHLQGTINANCDIITAPAKIYKEWLELTEEQRQAPQSQPSNLHAVPYWTPPENVTEIQTLEAFQHAIETNTLDISHPLTTKGIEKFVADWKAILA